jgi:integrase
LTRTGVNLFEKKLTLAAGTTKNGKTRTVFMPEPLYQIIQAQHDRSSHDFPKCPYVFHKAGRKIGESRKAWERAPSACGYKANFKCRVAGRSCRSSRAKDGRKKVRRSTWPRADWDADYLARILNE